MLMGRAPFAGNSPSEIFRNTCHGRLGLGRGGASLWDKLPSAARELIVGLMQLDHNIRFTGEQAMNHPWLTMPDEASPEMLERGASEGHGRRERSSRQKDGERGSVGGGSGSRSSSRSRRRSSHGSKSALPPFAEVVSGTGANGTYYSKSTLPPFAEVVSNGSMSSSHTSYTRSSSGTLAGSNGDGPSGRVRVAA